ncbi:MAG: hypothetical protein ACRDFB_07345, partial [Rhabdochlamydiaceae bacterium]
YDNTDKYIKISEGGKSKLKLKGKLVDIEFYPFTNKKKLVTDPTGEVRKITKKINSKYGKKRRKAYKFKCGEYLTNAQMDEEFLEEEIERYFREYSGVESGRKKADYTEKWLKGIQVFTFNQQEELPPRGRSSIKKKKRKPKKKVKKRLK